MLLSGFSIIITNSYEMNTNSNRAWYFLHDTCPFLFKTNHGFPLASGCGGSAEDHLSINATIILGAGKLRIAWTVSAKAPFSASALGVGVGFLGHEK